ncbi:hypothetical protein V9T40_005194 [Parthenolecanium corni]|uniref:Integrase catalytic domain-containing protein n=1 Tax=Parthenolecanium corni TaxID=536013 RepID=A0AAN9TFE3_9HEMI
MDEVAGAVCVPNIVRQKFRRLLGEQERIFDKNRFGCCSVYTHDFTLTDGKAKNYQVKFYPIPQILIMDMFTKFVRLYPVKFATTEASIDAVKMHLAKYGTPKKILTDNGRQFNSDAWRNFWTQRDMEVAYISAYRPASNPVERVMATLGNMLRLYSRDSHRRWPMLIADIEIRIIHVEHITTQVPPVALQLKKFPAAHDQTELVDLSKEKYRELYEIARQNIRKAIKLRNECFDQHVKRIVTLTPGHIVYVKSHHLSNKAKGEAKKLFPLFEGPYVVVEQQSKNSYLLHNLHSSLYKSYHLNNLKI